MASLTSKERILRFLYEGEQHGKEPIGFREILAALGEEYSKGTISGRLSELVREGIIKRDYRGAYRLVYAERAVSPEVLEIIETLSQLLPKRTLQSTVIWDPTPFLSAREDGFLGTIRVIETPRFTDGSVPRMVSDYWPYGSAPLVEEFRRRRTMLNAVAEDSGDIMRHKESWVVVAPIEGHYAATVLHEIGIRIATKERILMDFLGTHSPSMADVIRLHLTSRSGVLDPTRLFSAAKERNNLPALFAILAQLEGELHPQLREAYMKRLPVTARVLLEGLY